MSDNGLYVMESDSLCELSVPCRQIPVPQETRAVLWDHCIRLINRTFVEG